MVSTRAKKKLGPDTRLYREEWKSQFLWLVKENSKQGKKCTFCNIAITGSKTHLQRHEESAIHKKAVAAANKTLKMTDFIEKDSNLSELAITDAAKRLELRLCLFVAEHNLPFSVLNHLSACIKEDATDSKIIKKMSINRIKAQKIIKSVTGPQNAVLLSTETKQSYFSLVVDESTDTTMCKNLAIIIRTFDNQCRDRFLALAPINDCSAQGIFDTIIHTLNKYSVPIENLIAFTADNCSVMMGKHNGVQAKLRAKVPKLLVNGCICHNLNLIAMEAALKLPSKIDKLIRAINHHFCNSPSRKADFEKFQITFGTELHTILKYAPTRWLSRQVSYIIFFNLYNQK